VDEKNKLGDEIPEIPKQGSGSLLAAARKKQSRTVEEIADELNLSVSQIRTIELDQSEGLPEPTYVRGYIRSYARLLGLDADEVLEHYLNPNWQRGARLDDMPRGIGSANERDRNPFFTPTKIVTAIVLLSVLGFLVASGQFSQFLSGSESGSTNGPSQTSLSTSPTDLNVRNEEQQISDSIQDNTATEIPDEASQSSEESLEPLIKQNSLSFTFSDTSWVDIRDGDGERLAYKSYTEGEDLSVTAATPMSVFLGNAKAVSVELNGEPYDIEQYKEGVFARFTVGE